MAERPQGLAAWAVDAMIRRNVRSRFRGVYWRPPTLPVPQPAILVPNHHGWHDGYVMYLAMQELNLKGAHDWIQEYDAFPLFGKVGGMPFPKDDPIRRAKTIRETLRFLKDGHSLLLFAEQHLHRPPELLPFGKSLDFLVGKAPSVTVIPVAIKYQHSVHERPEAYLWFGNPMEPGDDVGRRTRLAVSRLLDCLSTAIAVESDELKLLSRGSLDVNERMDWRKNPFAKNNERIARRFPS